jgi:hypothetical protein
LWTICLGWPWTTILLISASQLAGITGMSCNGCLKSSCRGCCWCADEGAVLGAGWVCRFH